MKTFEAIIPAPMVPAVEGYHFSPAVRDGNVLYLSGQVGFNPEDMSIPDDFATQVENTFGFIDLILKEAGGSLADIMSMTSYHVGDLVAQLPIIRDIKTRLLGTPHPAWTSVGVTELAIPGLLIEIAVIARLK